MNDDEASDLRAIIRQKDEEIAKLRQGIRDISDAAHTKEQQHPCTGFGQIVDMAEGLL